MYPVLFFDMYFLGGIVDQYVQAYCTEGLYGFQWQFSFYKMLRKSCPQ